MTFSSRRDALCALLLAVAAAPASAQDSAPQHTPRQALQLDVFASSDTDGTTVRKAALTYDYRYVDIEHYRGIAVESARFAPGNHAADQRTRAFYRFADGGDRWKWNASLGTDGDTWLGSGTIHTEESRRQEYFVEREQLETPLGLSRGLYYTFVGAALDAPLNERNVLTALAGVQAFSGDNLRSHARVRYIAVLHPQWGLRAQLRLRAFRNSTPREFDYYSPRWYAETIPALELRRFHAGWQFSALAGVGRQRDAGSEWRQSRLVEATVTSPKTRNDWFLKANLAYTNSPSNTGQASDGYAYRQLMVQVVRQF